MNIGYAVVEKFYPQKDYKEISGMNQIEEIISLDYLLCSSCIHTFNDEDAKYIFRSGDFCDFDIFNNLDYLLSKIDNFDGKQVLAVIKEPTQDCGHVSLNHFKFYGYDLLEDCSRRSVLTNCCGLYDPFFSKEVSKYGLIEDYHKAKIIQKWLIENEPSIHCCIWAIFRMEK
ncbi:hypothetical protein KHQ81_06885 [Mycoplasmatota bacterium]|nr:hypothetical protein KHQ81_06885 [Mycoplasmatota bacterium]